MQTKLSLNAKWLTMTPTASRRGIEDGALWLDSGAQGRQKGCHYKISGGNNRGREQGEEKSKVGGDGGVREEWRMNKTEAALLSLVFVHTSLLHYIDPDKEL